MNNFFKNVRRLEYLIYEFGKCSKYDFLLKCLDSIDDGISISDKDGILVYGNKVCTKVLGGINIFNTIKRSKKLTNTMAGKEAVFKFENIIGNNRKIKKLIQYVKLFLSTMLMC